MVRSQETAAPLAHELGLTIEPFQSGLNEIDAGIFEGAPVNVGDLPLGGALYLLAPALWTLGLTSVPELGSTDANGIVFDERVSDAIQTIYNGSTAGDTDAVFSHEGTIAIWTLMNVNNPDYALVLKDLFTTGELLPYTGQVVVDGSPGDWTSGQLGRNCGSRGPRAADGSVRRLPQPDRGAATRRLRHLRGACSPAIRRRSTARFRPA